MRIEQIAAARAQTESSASSRPEVTAPASPAQAGLWSVMRIFPDCIAYNGVSAYGIVGEVDADVLRAAFDEVIRRHEVLRTSFTAEQGAPVQVVAPRFELELPLMDLRELPPQAREAHGAACITRELAHRFDLERGPLVRATLLRYDDAKHVLVTNIHRIVMDYWSVGVLAREMALAYAALAAGKTCDYPAPKVQYRDYAQWRSEQLRRGAFDADVRYWKAQLQDLPPLLNLPTDRPRPTTHSFRGDLVKLAVDPAVSNEVRALAQRNGMTVFAPLLTAFKILLSRYSCQTDIVVGSPLADRGRPDYEGLIGFFVNTLLLRTKLAGKATFEELCADVWRTILDALEHRDAPFELLLQELRPSRTLSYHTLFQVMFALQNVPRERFRLAGLEVEELDVPMVTSKFDIMWSIFEGPSAFEVTVEYDTDLFDRSTIVRMVQHYLALLADAVRHPGEDAARLSMLAPEELKLIEAARQAPSRSSYVLDSEGRIAPIGVPGELYVEDRALATSCGAVDAATVVHLPHPLHPAERLYATGLRARYLPGLRIDRLSPLPAADVGSRPETQSTAKPAAPEALSAEQPTARESSLEQRIAGIWQELLERKDIGMDDDFFALGGYSLLAARVVSRVNAACSTRLSLRALFDAPTIRKLSAAVQSAHTAQESTEHRRIPALPRGGSLPVSFAQERMWFVARMRQASAAYNTQFGLHLRGALDVAVLRSSIRSLVARHESLRTTFVVERHEIKQVIHPLQEPDLPVVIMEPAAPGDVTRIIREERAAPFDLAVGPLVRLKLLALAPDHHLLVVTTHHIVTDGWSMNVFIRELAAIYSALAAGEEPRLGELPVQYADYATWQREKLVGEALSAPLEYWKKQLRGAAELLRLDGSRTRPATFTYRGTTMVFRLPQDLLAALKHRANRSGATLFMVLLAAFQEILHRRSGQDDILVGVPIANRNYPELENVVGLFVNTLVIRTDFARAPTFEQLLEQVKATTLEAYANQDVPFEKLVAELAPRRSTNYHPLFQAMFVFHEAPSRFFTCPNLTIELTMPEFTMAPFDLSMSLAEDGDTLRGELLYSTDLFDEPFIHQFLDDYLNALRAAGAKADTDATSIGSPR